MWVIPAVPNALTKKCVLNERVYRVLPRKNIEWYAISLFPRHPHEYYMKGFRE